ncbi:MAG: hypothetical protein N2045_02425 [Fimbriimonadales bacterium]|nr:hypothetical protein [Fimbriimonadales bacterium]
MAIGVGAPLYLPAPTAPEWLDPRLFAQDEDEWLAIEYRMRTEPLEVIALAPSLEDAPPILAPYVRVVGWIVEREPTPPLPSVPVLKVERLPRVLPPDAMVVLDANAGVAYIDPSVATLTRYQSQLLRVATHTRYHIESQHLPVRTWDGQTVAIGGRIEEWAALESTAQIGAELVVSFAVSPPEKPEVPHLAHHLGGKPLWWVVPREILEEPELQESLWRWSAEMNLTLIPHPPERLAEWLQAMEAVKLSLRAQHTPIGRWQLGWLGTLPDREEDSLPLSAHLSEAASLEAFWEVEQSALEWGLYRAVLLPDAEPATLATGLAAAPHALIVPPTQVPLAKERVALLATGECRAWFLQRLNQGDTETLLRQPEAWIRQRR